MRFTVEIPHQFDDLLKDLALESFRTIPAQAAYLIAKGIEETLLQREQAREHTLDAFLARGDCPHCQPEVEHE